MDKILLGEGEKYKMIETEKSRKISTHYKISYKLVSASAPGETV